MFFCMRKHRMKPTTEIGKSGGSGSTMRDGGCGKLASV
jgi:hypothetical protein